MHLGLESRRIAFGILAALALILPTACDRAGDGGQACPDNRGETLSSAVVEGRIATVLPQGWHEARRVQGAVPYGFVPGSGWDAGAAIGLTFVGPERVAISGYYCAQGTFCPTPIEAHESLEIWIVPSAFAEAAAPPAWTTRAASLIARCREQALYGMVSRDAGAELDFDGGFTQSSTETSRMPPRKGDLATSWQDWRQDLAKALR